MIDNRVNQAGQSRRIVCVLCPKGCVLTVRAAGDVSGEAADFGAGKGLADAAKPVVTGNGCKKGIAYGIQEMIEPMRTLTTTVRTGFSDFPRLPVRTSADVPLRRMREYTRLAAGVLVSRRLKPGDTVLDSLPETDAVLVATADMTAVDVSMSGGRDE